MSKYKIYLIVLTVLVLGGLLWLLNQRFQRIQEIAPDPVIQKNVKVETRFFKTET